MKFFCNHDWTVNVDTYLSITSGLNALPETISSDNVTPCHIVVMTCVKCGKIYKTVTRLNEVK